MKNILKDGLHIYLGGFAAVIIFSIFSPFIHLYTDAYSFLLDGEIKENLVRAMYGFGLMSLVSFSLILFPISWVLFSGISHLTKKRRINYKIVSIIVFVITLVLLICMDFFGTSYTGPIN